MKIKLNVTRNADPMTEDYCGHLFKPLKTCWFYGEEKNNCILLGEKIEYNRDYQLIRPQACKDSEVE